MPGNSVADQTYAIFYGVSWGKGGFFGQDWLIRPGRAAELARHALDRMRSETAR